MVRNKMLNGIDWYDPIEPLSDIPPIDDGEPEEE